MYRTCIFCVLSLYKNMFTESKLTLIKSFFNFIGLMSSSQDQTSKHRDTILLSERPLRGCERSATKA